MYTSENIKRRNPIGSSTTRDQSLQQPQDDHHHNNPQNRASDPYGQNPLKPAFQLQQHQQPGGSGGYGYRDHYQFGYAPPRKEYSANKVLFLLFCVFVLLQLKFLGVVAGKSLGLWCRNKEDNKRRVDEYSGRTVHMRVESLTDNIVAQRPPSIAFLSSKKREKGRLQ